MTVALGSNIANPISTALSQWPGFDTMGKLANYGKLGATDTDAVIKALFANSEVGVWYDPSDLTTMFQDRAGTTPVTADGQTVGLILDKSKGLVLGSELIADASFDTPASWTPQDANWSVSGGKATYSDGGLSYLQYAAGFTITAGKWYQVNFTISGGTEGYNMCWIGLFNSDSSINLLGEYKEFRTNGSKTVFFYASSSTTGIRIYGNNASIASWSLDSFSVKEISGNHAVAPSDAARPLYKTDGTYHWLQFDGVDDCLGIDAPGVPMLNDLSIFYGAKRNGSAPARIVNQQQAPATYNCYEMGWNANSAPATAQAWYQCAESGGGGGESQQTTWPTTQQVFCAIRSSNVIQFRRNASNDGAQIGPLQQPVAGGTVTFRIGMRQDNYAPLNGNLYSIIVRGALSTADEITNTETWVNSKTGAF